MEARPLGQLHERTGVCEGERQRLLGEDVSTVRYRELGEIYAGLYPAMTETFARLARFRECRTA